MDLGAEEVQKASKEWVQGQRKTSLDMGGEKDALTLAQLGLDFSL